jgi:predicted DNA-binding protein
MANIHKEHPRYNVVSLRITDAEKEAMEQATRSSHKSMSKLLREAIELYIPLIVTKS